MRINAIPIAVVALAACGRGPSRAAPRAASQSAAVSPVPAESVTPTCAAASAWWKAAITPSDSGQVTAGDTNLVPPLGEQPVAACQLRVWLPHGMREGRPALGDSGDSVPAALERSGRDWGRLIQYDADGPDGSLSGYQRGHVRCTVAQSWDGGDDSDTSYVPEAWYRQELTCWLVEADH